MEQEEENIIRIADYLDQKMSAEEAMRFVKDVGNDELLREQYENELLIGALLSEQGIRAEGTSRATSARDFKKAMVAAAVVVFLIGLLINSIFVRAPGKPVALTNASPIQDPAINHKTKIEKAPIDSLYAQFYLPYTSTGDPVEVSAYLFAYKAGRFREVLNSTILDIQQMGVDNTHEKELDNFLLFYKGISYLALKQPKKSLVELELASRSVSTGTSLYYSIQWYKLLAYLGSHQVDAASVLATKIALDSDSVNSYKGRAEKLLEQLRR